MILIKFDEGWTLKQLASVFWLSEVTWRAIIKDQKLIQKLDEKKIKMNDFHSKSQKST